MRPFPAIIGLSLLGTSAGLGAETRVDYSLCQAALAQERGSPHGYLVRGLHLADDGTISEKIDYPATGTGIPYFGSRFRAVSRVFLDDAGRPAAIQGLEHGRGRLVRKGRAYTWFGTELDFVYAPGGEDAPGGKCVLQRRQAIFSTGRRPDWFNVIDLQVCRNLDRYFAAHPELLACRALAKAVAEAPVPASPGSSPAARARPEGLRTRDLVPHLEFADVEFNAEAESWSDTRRREVFEACAERDANVSVAALIRAGERWEFMSASSYPNPLSFAAAQFQEGCSDPTMRESMSEANRRFGVEVALPFHSSR